MRLTIVVVMVLCVLGTGPTSAASSPFERSLADRGPIPDSVRGYYGAIWVLLERFPNGNELQEALKPLSVTDDRDRLDSLVSMWFRSLDTKPTEPGNTYLQELWEKVRFMDGRGFFHPNERHPAMFFDEAGDMILINGLPTYIFTMEMMPLRCMKGSLYPVAEYHINWTGEEFFFQENCSGRWEIVGTDYQGGPTPWHLRAAALRVAHQYAVDGLTVIDKDRPIDANSAIAEAFAVIDDSDCLRAGIAINLGVRIGDFLDDSVDPPLFRLSGHIALRNFATDSIIRSIPLDKTISLASGESNDDDLATIQEVVWLEGADPGSSNSVVGLDLINPDDHHWKRSIEVFPRVSTERSSLSHSWLVAAPRPSGRFIGGWVPATGVAVSPGDSITILCFLEQDHDLQPRQRDIHAEFAFRRIADADLDVEIGRLYRLGEEPTAEALTKLDPPDAIVALQFQAPPGCHYLPVRIRIPQLRSGNYRIIGELRNTGPEQDYSHMILIHRLIITKAHASR
ncbi:MAG: hypothetical protein Kow0074_18300 [Candidatus Zixiibacteriota bacterium]